MPLSFSFYLFIIILLQISFSSLFFLASTFFLFFSSRSSFFFMCFLPFLSFLVLVLPRRHLLIPLFLVVHFIVLNVAPSFFIFLLPNAIFISIYRCLVAIRPPPLISLPGPSNHFFGRLSGRRPFRRSASLFANFGYFGHLSHVDI